MKAPLCGLSGLSAVPNEDRSILSDLSGLFAVPKKEKKEKQT
jgi:hypothetical protein